jgi:RNA polymerase sigma-70 factor (ECF subfamily)
MENRLGDVSRGTTDSSTASAQPGPLEIHGAHPCISLLWDESDFDRLYEKYSPTVYAVAFRVLEDPSGAEDVLQDVFLRVWSRPACLDVAQKSPRKWLETISRNRAIDMLRRRNLNHVIHEIQSPPSGNSFEAVECGLLLDRTRFLIRRLPPLQREAVEMAFYLELTHAEIAHRLKTPLGTIKTRIRTGIHAVSISMRGESSTRC